MSAVAAVVAPTHDDLAHIVGDMVYTLDELPNAASVTSSQDTKSVRARVEIQGAQTYLVEVQLDMAGATAIAQAMFDLAPGSTAEADLHDAVGEIANIVAGNTKSLADSDLTLGLPQTDTILRETTRAETGLSTTHPWRGHDIHVTIHPPGEKS